MFRRTKIVATLGPSTSSREVISELKKRGVNVFRINLAHGSFEDQLSLFNLVKDVGGAVLIDLPGPKIRVGDLSSPILLKEGEKIRFSAYGNGIPVDREFFHYASEGGEIFLADGIIKLKVLEIKDGNAICIVEKGGVLTSRKGINIPDIKEGIEVTERDLDLLNKWAKFNPDFIGLSFVRTKHEILKVKSILNEKDCSAWVISKIEKKQALENLEGIVSNSDGIMVARGDLAVEIGIEKLPEAQIRIINISRAYGKPVILATQVLESMVSNVIPTRAEIIDVSNSVISGVDAIMLSEETAIGKYPLEAIDTLNKIIVSVEVKIPKQIKPTKNIDDAIAYNAVRLAEMIKAEAIVAASRSGKTVLRVARHRPTMPILGLIVNDKVLKKMELVWGVMGLKVGQLPDLESLIYLSNEKVKEVGLAKIGDYIVIVTGDPREPEGRTNILKVHKVF
jgi:pyruvate kinase